MSDGRLTESDDASRQALATPERMRRCLRSRGLHRPDGRRHASHDDIDCQNDDDGCTHKRIDHHARHQHRRQTQVHAWVFRGHRDGELTCRPPLPPHRQSGDGEDPDAERRSPRARCPNPRTGRLFEQWQEFEREYVAHRPGARGRPWVGVPINRGSTGRHRIHAWRPSGRHHRSVPPSALLDRPVRLALPFTAQGGLQAARRGRFAAGRYDTCAPSR